MSKSTQDRRPSPGPEPEPATLFHNNGDPGGSDLPDALATSSATPPGLSTDPDPDDVARFVKPIPYADWASTRHELLHIDVGRPPLEVFLRTHPEGAVEAGILEYRTTQDAEPEFYLVDPSLWDRLGRESRFSLRTVVRYVTHEGGHGLWPLRQPRMGREPNAWVRSALEIAVRAQQQWVRLISDHPNKSYTFDVPEDGFDPPAWTDHTTFDMIRLGFGTRIISDWEHPILKSCRGSKS